MVAIFVLLTIVGFLFVDWVVQLVSACRCKALERGKYPIPPEFQKLADPSDPLKPPQGLFFHKGHCWAQIEPWGTVKVGLDGLVSSIIGRIDEVKLPKVGLEIKEGDPIASIRQGEHVLTFVSPIDGLITSVNPQLCSGGDCMKAEPYGAGWICVVHPKSLAAQARRLVVGEDVAAWYNHELNRMKAFFGNLIHPKSAGAALPGGLMEKVPASEWQRFQKEFLFNGQQHLEDGVK
jgi:glycine cleavage system H lipoate-binding protein